MKSLSQGPLLWVLGLQYFEHLLQILLETLDLSHVEQWVLVLLGRDGHL